MNTRLHAAALLKGRGSDMARIRTVKPEFWTSEQVMEISPVARLAFIAIWTFSDDRGVHPASVKTLRAEAFAGDDLTADDVSGFVNEMIREGLVVEFENQGKRYWHVTGWAKHQRIDKPTFRHPEPPNRREVSESSTNSRRILDESSPTEGIGMERIGEDLLTVSNETGFAPTKPDPLPNCPHERILAIYAEELPELTQPRTWNGQREVNLRARWRWLMTATRSDGERYARTEIEGTDYFRRLFRYIRESDFLMGRKGQWAADLEWLVQASNFAKVIDGKYDNREAS